MDASDSTTDYKPSKLTRAYNYWCHEQPVDDPTGLGCQRCGLHKEANQVVFGEGNEEAKLVVIAEAPGEQEDRFGSPLIGPAGQLLRKQAHLAGVDFGDVDLRLRTPETASCVVTWGDVYMTNVVGCRPPSNRNPMFDEIWACRARLEAIISAIRPVAILILGSVALTPLTGKTGITKNRGQWLQTKWAWKSDVYIIPALATFHPAALLPGRLKDPNDLERFRQDIRAAYDRSCGATL